MASTVFGLNPVDPKKKFTLQSAIGQTPVDDQQIDPSQIPTSPYSALPAGSVFQGIAQGIVGKTPTVRSANIPANYKFSGTYDVANRGLSQEESDAALGRRNTLATVDEDFQKAQRKAAELKDIAFKQLQQSMANRGLSFSGINVDETGKQEKNYVDYLNDLGTSRGRALAGVENNYAGILNDIARRREGLFGAQQKDEEDRRLREEQVKAQAEAARVQREQQQAMLAEIAKAQEAARQAAQAAAAARALPTYSAPSLAGGGGGGYYAPQPAPEPQAAPTRDPNVIALPPFGPGASESGVKNWIVNNVDRGLANNAPALDAVMKALIKAGGRGLSLAEISATINNTGYGQGGVL